MVRPPCRKEIFRCGFSLVELVIATSIIVILSLAAVTMGDLVNQREREVRLRQALLEMRSAIDRYRSLNNNALPGSMGALLNATDSEGFPLLRRFPYNPIAFTPGYFWQVATITYYDAAQTTWIPAAPPYVIFATTTVAGGIADIRAAADSGDGINGKPYREW